MAKAHPKVSELVEILLQEVTKLQKSVDANNQTQMHISKKIDETIIKVDVSELQILEQQHQKNLRYEFDNFNREIKVHNDSLLKLYNYINSKKVLYLVSLNIFLILCSGISIYIAVKKTVQYSDLEVNNEANTLIKGKLNNVKSFFDENPKVAKQYKEWNENLKN